VVKITNKANLNLVLTYVQTKREQSTKQPTSSTTSDLLQVARAQKHLVLSFEQILSILQLKNVHEMCETVNNYKL